MILGTLSQPQKQAPHLFSGLAWSEFKAVEKLLDRPGYRLSFLAGLLEIKQRPGELHETVKERLGALLELYLMAMGFDFTPTGSMTLENEVAAVKREADKSYKLAAGRSNPDLVIEVVFTSGSLNKLEAYRRLNIPEVWFWEDGVLDIYHLWQAGSEQSSYEKISQSEEVPGINLDLLLSCVNMLNHVEALKTFQKSLLGS
jgi:Uma2 family endonuclease